MACRIIITIYPGQQWAQAGIQNGRWCGYSGMIRFAHPSGRLSVVQRALRFCPACAGMTELLKFVLTGLTAHPACFAALNA
jgi:hypothetical protein